MKKKIILINLILAIVLFTFINTVHAVNVGKINFEAINNSNGTVIENLEVSIYRVSKQEEDGNFILDIGFENCEIDIDDLTQENIENLKTFATQNAEPVFTQTTDLNGKFTLENLELGSYIIVQKSHLDTVAMQTMLVTLPELTLENGLKYEITAKPKISEIIQETPEEPIPDEELPATGTLDWLVPLFAIAGLIIFCITWLKLYTTSKKKSKLGIIFMVLSIIFLIIAVALLIYTTQENNRVEKDNLATVTELEKLYEQNLEKQEELENSQEQVSTELEHNKTIKINGYDYMGIIYIPILDNLAIPVLETYTVSNLKVSVCKYSGGIEKGNFVIAGHNYKSSFGKLSKLAVGNIAYFKDVNGAVYKYNCKSIEILEPNQVQEMTTGDWDLTLFTCSYNNSKRLAYRFELK